MATARQIAANRRNAQKCTGPISDDGKRVSRMNALQHGMAARILVLPYEDSAEYQELHRKLIEGYAPANDQERMLVDQVAAGYWRTMRARAQEQSMIDVHVKALKGQEQCHSPSRCRQRRHRGRHCLLRRTGADLQQLFPLRRLD